MHLIFDTFSLKRQVFTLYYNSVDKAPHIQYVDCQLRLKFCNVIDVIWTELTHTKKSKCFWDSKADRQGEIISPCRISFHF